MVVSAPVNTVFTEPSWLFDETLRLLEETRDYLESQQGRTLPPDAASRFAIEGTRLTARLVEMMAWLLGRRAVAKGEISFEAGRTAFRLSCQAVCGADERALLPPSLGELSDLLRRSQALYQRIAFLDRGFDQDRDADLDSKAQA